jgi:hypothetical protein
MLLRRNPFPIGPSSCAWDAGASNAFPRRSMGTRGIYGRPPVRRDTSLARVQGFLEAGLKGCAVALSSHDFLFRNHPGADVGLLAGFPRRDPARNWLSNALPMIVWRSQEFHGVTANLCRTPYHCSTDRSRSGSRDVSTMCRNLLLGNSQALPNRSRSR